MIRHVDTSMGYIIDIAIRKQILFVKHMISYTTLGLLNTAQEYDSNRSLRHAIVQPTHFLDPFKSQTSDK